MKKITELKEFNNNKDIDALTDEQRYEWYLSIKKSLPALRKLGPVDDLERALQAYEEKHDLA